MDYTTLDVTKEAIRADKPKDDGLISRLVTAASRTADRLCGRSARALDYFKLETIANEELTGRTDVKGRITCWPHKSIVTAVTAIQYRFNPLEEWKSVETSLLTVKNGHEVVAWTSFSAFNRGEVMLKVSYTGGHAADTAGLPADFVEAVTVLAARFYREDESGLTDSVGVAELGTLTYTKSFPVRVKDTFALYTRWMPW